jgi:hypothetical protein
MVKRVVLVPRMTGDNQPASVWLAKPGGVRRTKKNSLATEVSRLWF